MTDRPGDAPARSFTGPRIIGGGLLALGLLVLVLAAQIGGAAGYSPVGPRFVPLIVGSGLVALAIVLLLRTTVRPDTDLAELAAGEERATHWPTVLALGGVLVGYALLMDLVLGYILATGLFLPVAARILGSRSAVRDTLVGFIVASVVWVGFDRVLGVRLPAGLLDPILPGSG